MKKTALTIKPAGSKSTAFVKPGMYYNKR